MPLTHKNHTSAFSLVEIIIVIGIMGVLAVLGSVYYFGAQEKARDNVRRKDVGEVKLGLETYYSNNNKYPAQSEYVPEVVARYFDTTPSDPQTDQPYEYVPEPAGCDNITVYCTGYKVNAQLESGETLLAQNGESDIIAVAQPTNTPLPAATNTPIPTATNTPVPTNTNTPVPTRTNTPVPTATDVPPQAAALNCWGINGECDASCSYAQVQEQQAYTHCFGLGDGRSYSDQDGGGKWMRCDGTEPQGIVQRELATPHTALSGACSSPTTGSYMPYGSTRCGGIGTSCYELNNCSEQNPQLSDISVRETNVCTVDTVSQTCDSYQSLCNVPQTWSCRVVLGGRTVYSGSSTCSTDGSGTCTKLSDQDAYILNSEWGCGWNMGGCYQETLYGTSETCTWLQ